MLSSSSARKTLRGWKWKTRPEEGEKLSPFKNFFSQTRKPEGFLGKIMLSTMNSGHAKLADWGMSHLPGISPGYIVDLGCGAGRNAGELLKRYRDADVTALDYSDLSVQKA